MKNKLTPEIAELLYQSLETELGGVQVYQNAIGVAVREDLKKEWSKYLSQTKKHVDIMRTLLEAVGMEPDGETPGRAVVRHIGKSLVMAIQMAAKDATPDAAQIVAAECVILAETKDHTNWELIGKVAEAWGAGENPLQEAYDQVEDEEDEHLYHTKGWCRELWIESLGLPAVLPPPEEVKKVSTAIGQARAQAGREKMLG